MWTVNRVTILICKRLKSSSFLITFPFNYRRRTKEGSRWTNKLIHAPTPGESDREISKRTITVNINFSHRMNKVDMLSNMALTRLTTDKSVI